MKILILILLIPATALALDTGIENLDVKGHATVFGYQSTDNQFDEDNSLTGSWKKSNIGALISYRFTHSFSAKLFTTSLEPFDFGYLQYNVPNNWFLDGIRAGRVNRLSGIFGGFGPHADRMNFLPQSTSPNRIGRTFFRYDGVQFFKMWGFGNHVVQLEYTLGKPIVADNGGIFDPTFYAVFDADQTYVSSDTVQIFNFNYYYKGFQFFADYVTAKIDFDTVYKAQVDEKFLALLLEVPPGSIPEGTYPIEEPISIKEYDIYTVKTGIAQAFGDIELIATYFLQVGDMPDNANFSIGPNSLGDVFKPESYTVMSRAFVNDSDMLYLGWTRFVSDFDDQTIALAGIDAPTWVDNGQGWFIGYNHALKQTYPQINIIGEFQHNRGGSYLSASFQDPLTSKRVWNAASISLNMYW